MTEVQTQDHVVTNDGDYQSGTNSATRTKVDPYTGDKVRQSSTRTWSGKNSGVAMIWLICGVAVAFLALDFIFHAAGANNVGFASFVFAIGTFLAAPFAGIFNTSYDARGQLLIWADLVAMVIYSLLAFVIAKTITIVTSRTSAA